MRGWGFPVSDLVREFTDRAAALAYCQDLEERRDDATAVQQQQSSTNGVNLDEELSHMVTYQQAYNAGAPVFRGIFEDNDTSKRLQVIVNYNTDISQYWEWSCRGFRPFDETNEAYKLGVNYLIYGLTH